MRKILITLLLACMSSHIFAQISIKLEKKGGVFYIPAKVNGLSMDLVFDTGASDVCLSLTEAIFMLKNGYLKEEDLGNKVYSQIANGEIVENTSVIIRNIEIGGINIQNVSAKIVNNMYAPLLLGQSAIQKLGLIQLNGNTLTIANGHNIPSEKMATELYNRAYQQLEAKEYDKAIITSLEGIKNTKKSQLLAALYDNLGVAYYNCGDKTKAIEALNHALQADANFTQARYNLGVFSYEMEQYENALRAFQLVVSNFENTNTDCLSASYYYIGEINQLYGRFKEGEEALLKSIDFSPKASTYLALANLYISNSIYDKAACSLKKYIQYAPNNPGAIEGYYKLGRCLYSDNKITEAYDAFKQSCNVFGQCLDIIKVGMNSSQDQELKNNCAKYFYMGVSAELWTARTSSAPMEAVKNYNISLTSPILKEEILWRDYFQLYSAHISLGDEDNAVKALNMGLKVFKDNPELSFGKALHLAEYSQEKIEILKKIIKNEYTYTPQMFDYGTVYNNIAWALCLQKKYNEGLTYSLKAVKRNPEHGYSWETLGELYFYLGKYQECISAMTKCIECKETNQYKSAYEMRGQSYMKLGNIKEGKNDLKIANNLQ